MEGEEPGPAFVDSGRSGVYVLRGIQIGAIVLWEGIHLREHGGCFVWPADITLWGEKGVRSPGWERAGGGPGGASE